MYIRVFKFFLILFLFYQSPLHSKTTSFNKFDSKDLSNYFSGIVAFENKKNLEALKFFNLSKILINQHDDYLKRYVTSLVLEKKFLKQSMLSIVIKIKKIQIFLTLIY